MKNINQPITDATGVSEWWFTRNIILGIFGIFATIATFSLIPQNLTGTSRQLAQNENTTSLAH